MGAKVVMACRSTERGEAKRTKLEKELAALVAAKISGVVGAGTLEVHMMEHPHSSFKAVTR